MKQYLLSVIQPVGEPEPETLRKIMADVGAVERAMRDAGVWVFAGALHDPGTTTTLRPNGDDVLVVDGPYAEGKEHLGGFTIVRAAGLDEALEWGRRLARATTLPIEVRPFQGDVEG